MAFRQLRQYQNFQGSFSSGNIVTNNVPVGGTHYAYYLRLLAAGAPITVAQIRNDVALLRVLVDGQAYIEADADYIIDVLGEYFHGKDGFAAINGALVVPLSLDWLTNRIQQDAFAWGTEDINNISIEITLASGAITVDSIELYVEKNDMRQPLGAHLRVRKAPENYGAAGSFEYSELPRPPQGTLAQVFVEYNDAAADLDDLTLTVGGTDLVKLNPQTMEMQCERAGRTPQINAAGTSYFPLDLSFRDDEQLGMAITNRETGARITDLRIKPTFDAAVGAVNYYYHYIYTGKGS